MKTVKIDPKSSINLGFESRISNIDDSVPLDISIATKQAEIRAVRRKQWVLPIVLLLLMLSTSLLFWGTPLFSPDSQFRGVLPLTIWLYGAVGLAALFTAQYSVIISKESELDILNARQKFESKPTNSKASRSGGDTQTYFAKLVQINVENLATYYSLVKGHTNKSFLVSVGIGALGFLLLVTGLTAGYVTRNTYAMSYVTSGAGVATEFISAVFFYLYNRTVRQMKDYHDSLLAVQNVLLSFKIVEGIEDVSEKAKIIAQMTQYLLQGDLLQAKSQVGAAA